MRTICKDVALLLIKLDQAHFIESFYRPTCDRTYGYICTHLDKQVFSFLIGEGNQTGRIFKNGTS
jgi:hypothetical protein